MQKTTKLKGVINSTLKFLASLKLAVIVVIGVAVISAVGTIYEARYDAQYAQKVVYHSIYMHGILALLCVNLIGVMVDRWPWKRRHAGFVLAHIGIITLLLGSWVTQKFGVDGSIVFGIGEKNRFVQIPQTELLIYASAPMGEGFKRIYNQQVDFLLDPPSRENPITFKLGEKDLKIVEYHHFALRQEEVVLSKNSAQGPGVRFQLQNDRVNVTEWLIKPGIKNHESFDLGPAKVTVANTSYKYESGNEIVIYPGADGNKVRYEVYTQRQNGKTKSGIVTAGDTIETGWMNLKFRLLKYLPHAERKVEYLPRTQPTPLTTSALKVIFDGAEHWVGLNSLFRFFTETQAYVLSFGNVRIDLGFDLFLKDFTIGRYQGTMRAASYQSLVEVPGVGETLISMNNPLKYAGYTFYQASFEEDESGRPVASVLSVNYDPGRWIKYFGSFLIVLGTIILFWFKRLEIKKKMNLQPKARKGTSNEDEDVDSAYSVGR